MIKGALILDIGFALGYVNATRRIPEVEEFFSELTEIYKTARDSPEPDLNQIPHVHTKPLNTTNEGESHG